MVFNPQNLVKVDGSFTLPKSVNATAHRCLNADIVREFWHNFSFRCSTLSILESDQFIFSIGNAKALPLENSDYTINVESNGVCVYAENEKDLMRGYLTMLDQIKLVDVNGGVEACIDCCTIREKPLISSRMVHYCIFPETELWELQRFIRLCGALKYTHVVLEFWGMLQYDCMKELGWSHAFTKEQVKEVVKEGLDLGLEIVPMFNHWGHASLSRVGFGKHVVLDQNPTLQTYFSEDGWCWDIKNPKVRSLLRNVREELTELCGNGKYFHIGCDEAYGFDFSKESIDEFCDYVNEISKEMNQCGRRIIMWGDMFLSKHPEFNPNNRYSDCNNPSLETEQYMLSRLDRAVILADWQYYVTLTPIETSNIFKNAGFDCLFCPWDRGIPQTRAAVAGVKEQNLMGFLHTTWNSLSGRLPFVTLAAMGGFESIDTYDINYINTRTATLLRKIMPANGDYVKCGWNKRQI